MKPHLNTPLPEIPYYEPFADECAVFEAAWRNRLPLLIKGPTGCGKTRFVAHMAARLDLPLHTVACHDDLSAADLIGQRVTACLRAAGMEYRPGRIEDPVFRRCDQ